jgi:hypothetical protein
MIGALILEATQAIMADKQQSYDDYKWFRASWQDIQTHRDGLTVDTSGSPWYVGALAKILPPLSEKDFDNSQLQLAKDTYVATAGAFGIIAVHDVFDNIQRLQGWNALSENAFVGHIKWDCYTTDESNY